MITWDVTVSDSVVTLRPIGCALSASARLTHSWDWTDHDRKADAAHRLAWFLLRNTHNT